MIVAPSSGHTAGHRRMCVRIVTSGVGEKRAWIQGSSESCPEDEEETGGLVWDMELARESEI